MNWPSSNPGSRLGGLTYLDIEIDDPARGLPCRVVYRPDAEDETVLWHARYERGFCDQKAKETLSVLRMKGFSCVEASPDPNSARSGLAEPGRARNWRCLRSSPPSTPGKIDWPPIPENKPDFKTHRDDLLKNTTFMGALEYDLARLGTSLFREATISDVAFGDLDDNGIDDSAILVTTKSSNLKLRHLLMVYFGDQTDFHFVDAEVFSDEQGIDQEDRATVDINSGMIIMSSCCGRAVRQMRFTLKDRQLSRVGSEATS